MKVKQKVQLKKKIKKQVSNDEKIFKNIENLAPTVQKNNEEKHENITKKIKSENTNTLSSSANFTTYIPEILKSTLKQEQKYVIKFDYFANFQNEIKPKMRMILIDWLIEVTYSLHFNDSTLFLTVNLIDRFLEKKKTEKTKLQLIGIAALLIATKYNEIIIPEISVFTLITENAYTVEELIQMEGNILEALQFEILYTAPCTILNCLMLFEKIDLNNANKKFELIKYLLELSLMDHRFSMIKTTKLIAIAIQASNKIEMNRETLSPPLQIVCNYSENEIYCFAQILIEMAKNTDCNLKALANKYQKKQIIFQF